MCKSDYSLKTEGLLGINYQNVLTTMLFITIVSTVIILVTQPPLGDTPVCVLTFELICSTRGYPTYMLILPIFTVILPITFPTEGDTLALATLKLL